MSDSLYDNHKSLLLSSIIRYMHRIHIYTSFLLDRTVYRQSVAFAIYM